MEEANWIGFEPLHGRLVALDVGARRCQGVADSDAVTNASGAGSSLAGYRDSRRVAAAYVGETRR
jgi:hypothetical protein